MSSYIGTFIDSEIYFLTELAISWLVISLSETNDRLFLCVVDQTSLPCLATFKKASLKIYQDTSSSEAGVQEQRRKNTANQHGTINVLPPTAAC